MKAPRPLIFPILSLCTVLAVSACERKQRPTSPQNVASQTAGDKKADPAKDPVKTPVPTGVQSAKDLSSQRDSVIAALDAKDVMNLVIQVEQSAGDTSTLKESTGAEIMVASTANSQISIGANTVRLQKNLDAALAASKSSETDATKKRQAIADTLTTALASRAKAVAAMQAVVGLPNSDVSVDLLKKEASRLTAISEILADQQKALATIGADWVKTSADPVVDPSKPKKVGTSTLSCTSVDDKSDLKVSVKMDVMKGADLDKALMVCNSAEVTLAGKVDDKDAAKVITLTDKTQKSTDACSNEVTLSAADSSIVLKLSYDISLEEAKTNASLSYKDASGKVTRKVDLNCAVKELEKADVVPTADPAKTDATKADADANAETDANADAQ